MCTGLGCARVHRAYERTHARHGVLRVYGEVINAQLLQGELLRALVSDLGEDGVRQREILACSVAALGHHAAHPGGLCCAQACAGARGGGGSMGLRTCVSASVNV